MSKLTIERKKERKKSRMNQERVTDTSKQNGNGTNAQTELQVEEQLKKIRQENQNEKIEYRPITYTSQGMPLEDALTYIECLKTQDSLCEKLKNKFNQTNHGE